MAKASINPVRPRTIGETIAKVPGFAGREYTYRLVPAKMKTSYAASSGGDHTAYPAARSDDTWFVRTKDGAYVGVLSEGGGLEPWAAYKLDAPSGIAPAAGARVARSGIRTGITWLDAVAAGWWNR